MQVVVPAGKTGGQLMQVQTPRGLMQVSIPRGLQAGQSFQFKMPESPIRQMQLANASFAMPVAASLGAAANGYRPEYRNIISEVPGQQPPGGRPGAVPPEQLQMQRPPAPSSSVPSDSLVAELVRLRPHKLLVESSGHDVRSIKIPYIT